jgi:hypothetical protein
MDQDGESCYPSVRLLAEETGLNKDTVSHHLKLAELADWIERQPRALTGKAWRRHEYLAAFPEGVRSNRIASSNVSEEIGQPTAEAVRLDPDEVSGRLGQRTYKEDVQRGGASQGAEGHRDAYPEAFQLFWAAYPQRAGANPKKAAHRRWAVTVRKGTTPEELEAAAQRYARYCDSTETTDTPYVKQAATFLGPDEHWRENWSVPSENGPDPEPLANLGRLAREVRL